MNPFIDIYANNQWRTGSGEGSLDIQTKGYQQYLEKFLREKQISSVIDMGCGDWQFSKNINWEGIAYQGYDVVPDVITDNIKNHSRPGVSFTL